MLHIVLWLDLKETILILDFYGVFTLLFLYTESRKLKIFPLLL